MSILTRLLHNKIIQIHNYAWKRYYILKPRFLNAKSASVCKDGIMLHVIFEVFCNYIEMQKPGALIDFDSSPEDKDRHTELIALYTWWMWERPFRKLADPVVDEDMLQRLMALKQYITFR